VVNFISILFCFRYCHNQTDVYNQDIPSRETTKRKPGGKKMSRNEIIEKIAADIADKLGISISRAKASVKRLARGRSNEELMAWM
jgi:DNA-binding MarR family transcriptional regulator